MKGLDTALNPSTLPRILQYYWIDGYQEVRIPVHLFPYEVKSVMKMCSAPWWKWTLNLTNNERSNGQRNNHLFLPLDYFWVSAVLSHTCAHIHTHALNHIKKVTFPTMSCSHHYPPYWKRLSRFSTHYLINLLCWHSNWCRHIQTLFLSARKREWMCVCVSDQRVCVCLCVCAQGVWPCF